MRQIDIFLMFIVIETSKFDKEYYQFKVRIRKKTKGTFLYKGRINIILKYKNRGGRG